MRVRRVVTGHSPAGKAVVASDTTVEPFTYGNGGAYHVLWGSDAPARFPDDGAPPAWSAPFPPVGGHRFLPMTIPPGGAHESGGDALAEQLARARRRRRAERHAAPLARPRQPATMVVVIRGAQHAAA